MNFFDPLLTSDGQPFHRVKYKQIVSEQVTLGYLTKGGVSYRDSEEMTPYERKIALDTITEILNEQVSKQNEMIKQAEMNRNNSSPKSRMTQ